ncbi:hypothetical protein VNO77_03908 [Canavalia gladiata]|uniref:Uncharacterized protein n=1 Tax=Canavalia gladiata TaxID=3824 RepID=A0AAN9N188_CANGL
MRGCWECIDWSSRGSGCLQEMVAWLHGLCMALSGIYWWPVTDLSFPFCMELHSYVHARCFLHLRYLLKASKNIAQRMLSCKALGPTTSETLAIRKISVSPGNLLPTLSALMALGHLSLERIKISIMSGYGHLPARPSYKTMELCEFFYPLAGSDECRTSSLEASENPRSRENLRRKSSQASSPIPISRTFPPSRVMPTLH